MAFKHYATTIQVAMVQHHIQHVPIKRDGKGWSKLVLRMMNSCCPIYLPSMVDHSKSENTLKVMDNALRLSGARVSVNSWMSQSQVDQLSKAIHRIDPRQATNVEDDDDQSNSNPPLFQNVRDVLKDVTNPYNLQINRRKNMLKAQKVQKLESVLGYSVGGFFKKLRKICTNFEVERTSSMGVSHVSGSLSIGT